MINLLNYLYNIDIKRIDSFDDFYIAFCDSNIYLFTHANINYDYTRNFSIISKLNEKSFFSYNFVRNIYNEFTFKYNDHEYVLLEIDDNYDKTLDLLENLDFYERANMCLKNVYKYTNIWDYLWRNNINLVINKVTSDLLFNDNMPYFIYYLGVCSTLVKYISIVNNSIHDKSFRIAFCHFRVDYNCKYLDFYNPGLYIIDLEIRDIASYIKSLFYCNVEYLTELEYYLKVRHLSVYEANMLYIRLAYPDLFFDEVIHDKKISHVLYNVDNYKLFLKKTYELINSYVNIIVPRL